MDPDDKFKINDRIPLEEEKPKAEETVQPVEVPEKPAFDKSLAFPTKDFESANSAVQMSGRVGKTKKKLWFLLILIVLIVMVYFIGSSIISK